MLKYIKLYPDVKVPAYGSLEAACFDIHAYLPEHLGVEIRMSSGITRIHTVSKENPFDLRIQPGEVAKIPTGLIFRPEPNFSVRLHSRSGMAFKFGLVLANGEGIVDSDYNEQVFVLIHNSCGTSRAIRNGDRIAQGELVRDLRTELKETTNREFRVGNRRGGFGSTGQ